MWRLISAVLCALACAAGAAAAVRDGPPPPGSGPTPTTPPVGGGAPNGSSSVPTVNAAIATIQLSQTSPQGLSLNVDGSRLYTADNGSYTTNCAGVANPPPTTSHGYVSVVDTSARKETAAIGSASGFPVYTASDPNGGLVYSGDSGGHTISVYNDSGLVGSIEVGDSLPHQVAIDGSNDHLVATNVHDLSGQWVGLYDLKTRSLIKLISVGAGAEPHGISIDQANQLAYVSSVTTNTVTVISTADGRVVSSFHVAGNLTNINALDTSRKRFYAVSNNNPEAVIGFDTGTQQTVGSVTVDSQPWGLGVESWSGRVLAVLPGDNAITVIDPSTWKELAHVPVGKCPFQIAVDDARKLAYVSDQADNAVTVVDLAKADASLGAGSTPSIAPSAPPTPSTRPSTKPAVPPKCKKGQKSTKKTPCRR
ncbi:MAG TPA: YncE family protein [Gaiellaceae bacterium]|nr:YncE family protein [Gaiellaceae bacterium]